MKETVQERRDRGWKRRIEEAEQRRFDERIRRIVAQRWTPPSSERRK